MFQKINKNLANIKYQKSLILNITNYVTMDFVANGLLSIGASPVMSCALQEAEDLLQLSKAVVINLGTLDENFVELCEYTCRQANRLKKPIILDPAGVGASRYRTETCFNLLNNYDIAIIRGNASEILSLSGESVITKGVDSISKMDKRTFESAKSLSIKYDAAVIVSGPIDIVVDGENTCEFSYGSELMSMITGAGCLLTAIVASFHAVEKNRFAASVQATIFYGKCGEKAARKAQGPASFKVKFIDELKVFPEQRIK